MSEAEGAFSVAPLQPGEEPLWASLLETSPTATLFHDLEFLGYHPPERFRFHHLIVRRNAKPIALIPGGLVGDAQQPVFASPVGASIGGPALVPGLRAGTVRGLVEALQDHARRQGWRGIEMTLPPALYHPAAADLVGFALFCCGFRLAHRSLCSILPLADGPVECFEQTFLKRQISPVRTARRRGVEVVECGLDGLDRFLAVFDDTYRRHGTAATHSAAEIADLLRRRPDRVRICLAMLDDVAIAGLLVLLLTAQLATTFYICSSTAHAHEHGPATAIAGLMTRLAGAGYRHLDLGPSASDRQVNEGALFFKEGLGAVGHGRDRWLWTA